MPALTRVGLPEATARANGSPGNMQKTTTPAPDRPTDHPSTGLSTRPSNGEIKDEEIEVVVVVVVVGVVVTVVVATVVLRRGDGSVGGGIAPS